METIRNALGYGTSTEPQSGSEPVSGQSGSGEGGEPFDAGNSDTSDLGGAAPQHTSSFPEPTSTSTYTSTSESGREPVSGQSGSGIAGEPYDAGNTGTTELGGAAPQTTSTSSGLGGSSSSAVTDQSGREPISGETGRGTASEPFDTGNTDSVELGGGAAQHTAASSDPLSGPTVDKTEAATSSTSTSDDNTTSTGGSGGEHHIAPDAIKAEDFPTVTDPSKAAKRDFDHDPEAVGDITERAGASSSSSNQEHADSTSSGTASKDKPLPDTPGQHAGADADDDGEGCEGKKKLSTKLKEKLHIGKH